VARSFERRSRRTDRAPFIRHLALCAAALVTYFMRVELRVGNEVLWIVAAAAILNLAVSSCSNRKHLEPVVKGLSSILGLAGWTTLASLTGGLASPFLAGLWLEIVLSVSSTSPAGVLLTTAGAVVGLWAQQMLKGLEGGTTAVLLLTGFLLLVGGMTLHLARRWRRSQTRMARRIVALRRRLARIETELGEKRALGGPGEDAARLAHGLKNAVHSMRGFVSLLEPQLKTSGRCHPLLDGLRSAIDHLEETAKTTLGPSGPRRAGSRQEAPALTPGAIREIVGQVAAAFPGVRWSLALEGMPSTAGAPVPLVRDALSNVLRNAAEAMRGRGEVQVEALPKDGHLEIHVRDHGPGLRSEITTRMFEPGRTTKDGGHGLGLFLARRLLEAGGGRLSLSPADGGGVLCSMELPLQGPTSLSTRAG
jgi:signal transduction histidine kinase